MNTQQQTLWYNYIITDVKLRVRSIFLLERREKILILLFSCQLLLKSITISLLSLHHSSMSFGNMRSIKKNLFIEVCRVLSEVSNGTEVFRIFNPLRISEDSHVFFIWTTNRNEIYGQPGLKLSHGFLRLCRRFLNVLFSEKFYYFHFIE